MLDDTGFPKDGKRSPGVKRQYSGTLGKVGNAQIGVSGARRWRQGDGAVGMGALYLPEDWCADPERRGRAKIPEEVAFKTKNELGVELVERAVGWDIPRAPVLGDQAYGDDSKLRERLDRAGSEYVLSGVGRPRRCSRARPSSRCPSATAILAGRASGCVPTASRNRSPRLIAPRMGAQVPPRRSRSASGPDGEPVTSRFIFTRVRALKKWGNGASEEPREEWLIAEWPEGHEQPIDYWLSNLPADSEPEQLARLARLRWKIELDYKQLKGELGLDHYEGRSYLGWYHHTALVTAAHGFLTLERLHPFHPRPA